MTDERKVPECGYSREAANIAAFLIRHRKEIHRRFLNFEVTYSNQDFDMSQRLADFITDAQRSGELKL